MDVYARWDPHKFVCGCCKVSKCFCGKQHLGNEKGCVRTICQALSELMTLTHIGRVMYYINASPSTLWLPSINLLITSTGNAGIVTLINL
eukprot:scaffold115948_cov35-Attheya_sp.AAC.1